MFDNPSILERLKKSTLGAMGGMSMMTPVGTGIATENKLLSSKECYFQIVELFPFDQSELKSDRGEMKDVGVDAKGEAYEVTVEFSKSVKATWLPQGGNRVTAPDIRRGERAEIFRLGDSDKYYWRALELDQGVRRLETAMFLFSNTQDESTEELTPENSWMVEMSTHQKTLSIKTPKSDGEDHAYDIQLNTKESTFVLQDDAGQGFELDSKERKWRVANGDGSEVLVDKKDITVTAPATFKVKCKDYIVEAENSISETSQSHTVSTQSYKLSSDSYSNTSQAYRVSTGTWSVSCSTGGASGSFGFNGQLTNNGVNVGSTHRHPGVRSGDSTTAPPQ